MKNGYKLVAVGIVIGLLLMVGFAVGGIGPNYAYRKAIGAYAENAKNAPNLEVMLDSLQKTRDGMVLQGLQPTDCGRALDWERTQDWCMAFQYQYIDGLIGRCRDYINRTKSGDISSLSDVYEQMMENMRIEMDRNGAVDWVAHPAWYLKNYPAYYWGGLAWFLGAVIVLLPVTALSADAARYRNEFFSRDDEGKTKFYLWAWGKEEEEES